MVAPPVYIRINTLKSSEETLLRRIEDEGISLEKVEQLRHTYEVICKKHPLTKTESFGEGLFYIQDKASCLATEIADPEAGMKVLDVCASPGAKTTYLAQLMENLGTIYSIDYSKRRMMVWKSEVKRMGVDIAVPMISDACRPLPMVLPVDLVVLDVPCTSIGALWNFPSYKWRITKGSISHMSKVQWGILEKCASFVKKGGNLTYSTCSITVEENEMLIEKFLKWFPTFKLLNSTPRVGFPGLRGLKKCQRLYPHLHNCNGFFVAKMTREI